MKRTMQRLAAAAMLLCTVFVTGVSAAGTNEVPPATVPEDLLAAAIKDDGVLRVLGIGNSYTIDGMYYLNQVFQAENPGYEVELSLLYKGSCSLQQHADRIDGDPADYTYYYFSTSEGKWKTQGSKTLDYAIEHSDWDFISLQQNSSNSGKPDTYSYLDTLVPHVLEKATNDDVKLLWHMTWPWSDQYSKIGPGGTYASQSAMYEAICSTVKEKISKDTFVAMIPAGTAVENVGSSHYSYDGLHRDDVHLSNVCRMAAAYTWYATLTGDTVDTNGFDAVDDANGLPVDMGVVVEAANHAIDTPFAITKSAYADGYSSTDKWTALTAADTTLSSGTYYLKDSLTATVPITVTGKVALVLNGKTLTACEASDGSFITVADGGTLTLFDTGNGAISGVSAGTATRGIEVQAGGALVLNSGTVSGFTTSGNGGGVLVAEGGAFTMNGGKVLGNTAANGGGICNNNGTLTFGGGSVAKNRATGSYGGGVYALGTAHVTEITGGSISGNYCAGQGGGVSIREKSATVTGGTIGGTAINSEAELAEGTGNYAATGGGGVYVGKALTFDGTVDICGNRSDTVGGGIRGQASVTLSGTAKIRNNHAVTYGGGVAAYYGLTIKGNVDIASNTAAKTNGTGVYLPGGSAILTMTAGTISGAGNLIYTTSPKSNVISGGTITGTVVVASNNAADKAPGKLEITGDAVINGKVTNYGSMTISGGIINGAVTERTGYATDKTKDYDFNLTITGGTINGAVTKHDSNKGDIVVSGGKFSYDSSRENLESWLIDGKFLHSFAGYYQVADTEQVLTPCKEDHTGWIEVSGPAKLDVEGGKYYLTTDVVSIIDSSTKYGIDVAADDVTLCMHGFSVVPADSGSSALRCGGTNFTLQNGTVDGGYLRGNSVKSVLVNKTGMVMRDNVHISGADITGGSSLGAAVQVNGTGDYVGSFTMEGGTISDNTITTPSGHAQNNSNYGAIMLNGANATVTLKGGTISGNVIQHTTTAEKAYVGSACVNAGGTLVITGDVVIEGNSATAAKSTAVPAVYNKTGTFTMSGGTIRNHVGSTKTGAGVYNSATFNLQGGTITGNETSTNGGGVYNVKTFTMTGGTISANKGTRGDQVYSYNDCTAVISGGTIADWDGNTTEGIFGASKSDIVIRGDVLVDSKIVLNDTGSYGKISISGGKFSDKMTREDLIGFLSADAGVLSVMDNTDADAATYKYKVGEGYNRAGEFMDFKSSLNLTITLGADVGFTADGVTVTVNGERVSPNVVGETMIVPVNGIVAKAMDDEYAVVVTKDEKTLYAETLSVYKLAQEWHKDAAHADDKVMLEDMINYGIEAQREFENGAVTMNALGTGTANEPDWGNVTGGVTGGHGDKVAITLSLKDKIELNVYVRDADATTTETAVKKTTVNAGAETVTRFTFDDIPVKDAKVAKKLTVTLADGVTTFDVEYSIADYVVMAKDGEQSALIEALMKYVDSVSAYLAQ